MDSAARRRQAPTRSLPAVVGSDRCDGGTALERAGIDERTGDGNGPIVMLAAAMVDAIPSGAGVPPLKATQLAEQVGIVQRHDALGVDER